MNIRILTLPRTFAAPLLYGLGLAIIFGITAQPGGALQPLGIPDTTRIFVGQHYRDGGPLIVCDGRTIFTDPSQVGQFIWDRFSELGLEPHMIAGIIGNVANEAFESLDPGAVNPTSGAYGLFQFFPPDKYFTYADRVGSRRDDPATQIEYVWGQLNGDESIAGSGYLETRAYDALLATNTAAEAAEVWAEQYERFERDERYDEEIEERIDDAEAALGRYGAGSGEEGEEGGTPSNEPDNCTTGQPTVVGDGELNFADIRASGDDFTAAVPDGNSADFVSYTLQQAGTPLAGGEGGWQYSSVTALQELFQNEVGYSYTDAGTRLPQIGDIAFFIDPERGIEYTGIISNVVGDQITVITYLDGEVVEITQTGRVGENGLVGYGRIDDNSVSPPPPATGTGSGTINDVSGLQNDCGGVNLEQLSASALNNMASGQYGAFHSDCFTRIAERPDNGSNGDGNFRIICSVSHFSYDDPIVFPGQPGASHLHMFWGNTLADANTNFTPGSPNNLLESGNSTCQGGPLNRSAYWAPAMLAGHGADAQVVVPKRITLYYKSKFPQEANPLPQGIQLLVGNVGPNGAVRSSFDTNLELHWGCYDPALGRAINLTNTIPGTNGTPQCPNGWDIQGSIAFPQCIQASGGQPVLTSGDFISHTTGAGNDGRPIIRPEDGCPASHPYRVPQISYLITWENPDGLGESNWRLSSDAGFDQPTVAHPGGSLHGDWLGGWHDGAIQAWMDGCFRAVRNCSLGQTGQNGTGREFRPIEASNVNNLLFYTGPQYISLSSATGVTSTGTPGGSPGNGVTGGPGTGPPNENYADNLAMIRAVTSYRNTNEDGSPYRTTPQSNLPLDGGPLFGPRSEYLGNPGGNPEQAFPVGQGGQFRTSCEFSHFAYDDPIVFPNKPGKAHLHMFFGNTDVNAYSTYDTLINSGGATCNGKELNRTGYWVPAMFDGNGNVRIPERVVVYYKGEGLANGNSSVYPERAAVLANENINAISYNIGGAQGKFSFVCSDQYSGASSPASNTMVNCPGTRYAGVRQVLEMNVKFPNCWNGGNPAAYIDSYDIPPAGSWYYAQCPNVTLPNLEYFVNYYVEPGENTANWYLSSDVDANSLTRTRTAGSSVHGDWWGGWHPDINRRFIDNCVNFRTGQASGCGFGYLTDGGPNGGSPFPGPALKYRTQYTGPHKVPAQQIFNDLCRTSRQYTGPESAAYCEPNS